MGKNNRENRRAKVKRQKERTKELRSSHISLAPELIVEYYQPVFAALLASEGESFDEATREAKQARCAHWLARSEELLSGEEGWASLEAYLKNIEGRIQGIVERHSQYFWLHLYRRVGLGLDSGLDNRRDARTLSLVRAIMEVAFVRFGNCSGQINDIRHTVLAQPNRDSTRSVVRNP